MPGTIVGPTIQDLCSPFVPVEVPLRGAAGAYKRGRLTLKAVAQPYQGKRDIDLLKLTCLPATP